MQTSFTAEQLQDPHIAVANQILRKCVHCGFCTATCPTYVLLGDELDSPRGRIYLIKNMLERGEAATSETVKHIDRCLSCLACMTTCPSGVHFMHLIDDARAHVERTYRRPLFERLLRQLLAFLMSRRALFRTALGLSRLARPLAPVLEWLVAKHLKAMLALAPKAAPEPETTGRPGVYPPQGSKDSGDDPRHQRIPHRDRPGQNRTPQSAARRLSFRLLHAAWSEHQDRAAPPAGAGRLRGDRHSGRPFMLWIGRHLQYPPAGNRNAAERPQDRQYQVGVARWHCHWQYRLHHPDRPGDGDSHPSHRGVA